MTATIDLTDEDSSQDSTSAAADAPAASGSSDKPTSEEVKDM